MLSVTINTNLKKIHDSQTEEVILPTSAGLVGVLTGHRPMVAKLDFGVLQLKQNGNYAQVLVGGGVAEVFEDNVKILIPYAEFPENIDLDRAVQAKERAEKRISDPEKEWDLDRAGAALMRAVTRISLSGKAVH